MSTIPLLPSLLPHHLSTLTQRTGTSRTDSKRRSFRFRFSFSLSLLPNQSHTIAAYFLSRRCIAPVTSLLVHGAPGMRKTVDVFTATHFFRLSTSTTLFILFSFCFSRSFLSPVITSTANFLVFLTKSSAAPLSKVRLPFLFDEAQCHTHGVTRPTFSPPSFLPLPLRRPTSEKEARGLTHFAILPPGYASVQRR